MHTYFFVETQSKLFAAQIVAFEKLLARVDQCLEASGGLMEEAPCLVQEVEVALVHDGELDQACLHNLPWTGS